MTDSVSELKRLLEEQEESLGTDDPKVAATLTTLGDLLCMNNRLMEAEPLYWRVLEIRHRGGGQRTLEVAAALQDLSILYEKQDSWGEAERLLRWCCDIKRELLGPQDPEYISSLSRLGRVLDMQGKQEDVSLEASPDSENAGQSLHGIERYRWAEHCAAAKEMLKRGHVEEAQRYLTCLGDTAACFAPDTVHHARVLNLQARTHFRLNQLKNAKDACEKALAIFEKVFGTNHLETMECLVNMANIHLGQHEYNEARFLYQWAHAIAITLEGEGSDKGRKLEQKIAGLPTGKQLMDPDANFLLDVQTELSFSTGEYTKPDLSKLAQLHEENLAAEASNHLEQPTPQHAPPVAPAVLSEVETLRGNTQPQSNSDHTGKEGESVNTAPAQIDVGSNSLPIEHTEKSPGADSGSTDAGTAYAGTTGREPASLASDAATRSAMDDAAKADQFFSQLEAMKTEHSSPSVVPRPTNQDPDNQVFSTTERTKPRKSISQFGRAFGLPEAEEPKEEAGKPSGPHYIEEFDNSVACFLWEKYAIAGERALNQKDYVEAERMYAVAVEKAYSFNDERLWKTLCKLGVAYQHQRKYVRAETVFKQAHTLCEKRLGPEHMDNMEYCGYLAELYVELKNFVLADRAYRRILHLMIRAGKPESETTPIRAKIAEYQAQLPRTKLSM